MDGFKAVDSDAINMMRTFGASRWQIFTKLQIPNSLPYLFTGMKIAIVVSVIGAVIGEWVGASEGLGYLMTRSIPQFQTDRVFVLTARPASVKLIVNVSLPRPRRYRMVTDTAFIVLKEQLIQALWGDEV
jgi:putative hydroxymethylpyrimidine transport system permease protein